ncbi:P22 phage major capsid protein family protein [Gluconobacter oxydans]|uniref:P22 phage major capsid protein family protein n=1 Tax=Gluconobacter oxydans TaxID=442 RepID=UPI0007805836|nr:P22 phage major capsid protein family protein [Gluconobacter oxydans]
MASNNLINNQMITKMALALRRNQNSLVQNVDRSYQNQFAQSGGKIGDNVNIRLPNDNVAIQGAVVNPQAMVERSIPLTIDQRWNTSLSFTTQERTLQVDQFAERYVAPAVNVLVGALAADLIGLSLQFSNLVRNVDADGNTIVPSSQTWLRANAILSECNAEPANRFACLDPLSEADTVAGLMGMFNPSGEISEQNRSGRMGSRLLGVQGWMQDNTVIVHQTGSYDGKATATGAVNSFTPNGQVVAPTQISAVTSPHMSLISTSAVNGTLNAGDIITITGVNRVNRITKKSRAIPMQFVVAQDCASGATSIPVMPALVPPNSDGSPALFQTVDAAPAEGATINIIGKAGEVTRRNFIYHKKAMTLATVDLEQVTGATIECGRDNLDGISLRTLTYYDGPVDVRGTRMDLLYGKAMLRSDWGVIVPSPTDDGF